MQVQERIGSFSPHGQEVNNHAVLMLFMNYRSRTIIAFSLHLKACLTKANTQKKKTTENEKALNESSKRAVSEAQAISGLFRYLS